jgi:hypothetical protein
MDGRWDYQAEGKGGVATKARAGWMDGLGGCVGLDFDPADTRKACSRDKVLARSAWSSASKRHEQHARRRLHAIWNIYKINTRVWQQYTRRREVFSYYFDD